MNIGTRAYPLLKIIVILFGMQIIRIIMKETAFQFVQKNVLFHDLITLLIMLIFIVFIILICKKRNRNLSIFSNTQTKDTKTVYLILTLIVLLMIISTPFFNHDFSADTIISVTVSAVVTPVFEELIFRGYVWNELKHYYKSERIIYVINTLLFAVWHLGYADSIWFRMATRGPVTGFPFIMLMKVITGLCFGIVIGFIRYKFKNCYAAILAHSFMNVFGR